MVFERFSAVEFHCFSAEKTQVATDRLYILLTPEIILDPQKHLYGELNFPPV